jgi:hypothetical protein
MSDSLLPVLFPGYNLPTYVRSPDFSKTNHISDFRSACNDQSQAATECFEMDQDKASQQRITQASKNIACEGAQRNNCSADILEEQRFSVQYSLFVGRGVKRSLRSLIMCQNSVQALVDRLR